MSKTEEGNFLIANFMGYNYPDNANEVYKASLVDLHNYHENWNLLMPVVEKIESTTKVAFNIFQNECWIADEQYRTTAQGYRVATKESTKIDAVYKAVIQFIQWYSTTFTDKTDNYGN